MKKSLHPFLGALVVSAILLIPSLGHAADGTWAAASSGNWGTPGNWNSSIIADGAGFTANIPFNINVTLAGVSQTIGILNLGLATGNSAVLATGGATLTMDNNGAQAQINAGATHAGTPFSVPLLMTAGGLKITTVGASLGVSGAISSIASSGTQTLTLSHNGGGNLFTVTSAISDGNLGGVVGVLLDSAGGPTTLTGVNSFTGGIIVRRGSIAASLAAVAANTITLGDGVTGANVAFTASSASTYTNDITVNSAGSGTVTLGIAATTTDLAGDLAVGRNTDVVVNNFGNLTLSGNASGAGRLNVLNNTAGTSTLNLTGSNSYAGGLETADWLLRVNIGSATAPGTGTWGIGHLSRNEAEDLRVDNVSGAAMTLANNNALRLANFTYVGSNNLNMGTGAVTIGPATAIMTVLSNTLTVGGVISGVNKNVGNGGAGTFVLTGANTYTGATYVGGQMIVSSVANSGTASNIGASTSAADKLVLNRGALQYTGTGATTDRLFTVGNGGGTLDNSGSGALIFNNTGAIVSTDDVLLTFANGNTTFPIGSTIINVGPSTSANTTANLAVGQSITGTNIAPGTVITAILDGSRIEINNATTGASVAGVYTFGALDRVLTLTGSNTGANAISGVLANAATKTLGVTKSGAGTWSLSGANTYTGATQVNVGTLLINGNNSAATGTVTVASGATLSGTGTIGGAVSVSGTLAAGNSPGNLTIANNVSLLNGSTMSMEITGATFGSQYDRVTMTEASSTFSLTSTNNLELTLSYTPAASALFFLVDNQSTNAISGIFEQLNGVTTTLSQGSFFTVGGTSFAISYVGDVANNAFLGGNDIVIQQAVPEPGTVAMLFGAAGMFLLLKSRRRQG